MTSQEVKQIIETIKTLNLNIDSHSAVEIVKEIKPIIWFYMIKGVFIDIFGFICFVAAIYLISRAVMSYYKNKK